MDWCPDESVSLSRLDVLPICDHMLTQSRTPPKDAPEVVRLQLLGTVDFDLDQGDNNKVGFQSGFDSAKKYIRAVGTKLQGAALIGMLNFDFQNHLRPIQNEVSQRLPNFRFRSIQQLSIEVNSLPLKTVPLQVKN